jgi:hypothetical protein
MRRDNCTRNHDTQCDDDDRDHNIVRCDDCDCVVGDL